MMIERPYQVSMRLEARIRRKAAQFFAGERAIWMGDRPCVTFGFDDAPMSAVETGAAILERAGARGMFYLCAGFWGKTTHFGEMAGRAAVERLVVAGHEIGCHSAAHWDCAAIGPEPTLADLDDNRRRLGPLLSGARLQHFAYPFGSASLPLKRALSARFVTARGVRRDLIRGGFDRLNMPGLLVNSAPDCMAKAKRALQSAIARRAWVIFFTHDVREKASPWGVKPGDLADLVAQATDGGARIATMSEALALGQIASARLND